MPRFGPVTGGISGGGGGSITVEITDGSSPEPSVTVIRVAAYTLNGAGDVTLLPMITGPWGGVGSGGLDFSGGRPILQNNIGAPTSALDLLDSSTQLYAQHTPGNLTFAGLIIETGTDFVGFWISEKDATTVQIYPDTSNGIGYDVELTDILAPGGPTNRYWKHVAADGGVAIPSLGMLPQYNAAPATPVEGQSYYDTTTHHAYTWDGAAWQAWW